MKQKTVIVTGGSGFIGTEVVWLLLRKKNKIIILDIATPKISHKSVVYIKTDLSKQQNLTNIFKNVDYCIHLAARVGGITFANKYPATILQENVMIDTNVISAAKNAKLKRFVYISSSLIYEKSNRFPYKEEDDNLPLPQLTYGLGKVLGEQLCLAANREFGLSFTICRLFNVYGINSLNYGDPHGHVIPDLIKKAQAQMNPFPLYGSGKQTRQFTHVKDVASGIMSVLNKKKAKNEIFNIAGEEEINIRKIANILWKLMYNKKNLRFRSAEQFGFDVKRSYADTAKINKLVGWQPKISIEEGLKNIIERN